MPIFFMELMPTRKFIEELSDKWIDYRSKIKTNFLNVFRLILYTEFDKHNILISY